MVNLREIKKDHTLFRNDFFKADPFLGVMLKSYELIGNIKPFFTLEPFAADLLY